jgi:hypothetical protein
VAAPSKQQAKQSHEVAPPAIVISATPRVVIPIALVGKPYSLTPPKATLAIKLAIDAQKAGDDPKAMWDALIEWVDMGFSATERDAITARLNDPRDELDIPHLNELMEKVLELQTGNPTG